MLGKPVAICQREGAGHQASSKGTHHIDDDFIKHASKLAFTVISARGYVGVTEDHHLYALCKPKARRAEKRPLSEP